MVLGTGVDLLNILLDLEQGISFEFPRHRALSLIQPSPMDQCILFLSFFISTYMNQDWERDARMQIILQRT